VVESEDLHDRTIHVLAVNAREEMKALNSLSHKSLLRESSKELEKFSWESLSSELKHTVPTLWMFLDNLLPNAKEKFICFIVSMILKMQCKQLCQVQKAVSMMLYANGVHKQVLLSSTRWVCIIRFCSTGLSVLAAIYGYSFCDNSCKHC